jgi:hypothetical protein
MPPTPSPKLSDAEALFGGRTIEVRFRDGTTRPLFLRLIRISEIPSFLELIATNEDAALRSVLPEGDDIDFDALAMESYEALMEANLEVNFTPALASQNGKLARAQKTGLGVKALLDDMVSISRSFAPTSPSLEAGPQTPSCSRPSPGSSSSGAASVTESSARPSHDSSRQD